MSKTGQGKKLFKEIGRISILQPGLSENEDAILNNISFNISFIGTLNPCEIFNVVTE